MVERSILKILTTISPARTSATILMISFRFLLFIVIILSFVSYSIT